MWTCSDGKLLPSAGCRWWAGRETGHVPTDPNARGDCRGLTKPFIATLSSMKANAMVKVNLLISIKLERNIIAEEKTGGEPKSGRPVP